MTKSKVLVTGGAGFIGSHLVEAYLEANYEVVVVDNLSSGNKDTVPANVSFYEADITDRTALEKVFTQEQPQIVNHHAAHVSLGESVTDPVRDAETNILGSLNVFQIAQKFQVKKILFASSGGAIYSQRQRPYSEQTEVKPVSPYGVAKRSAELYLAYFQSQSTIPTVAFRYANVYGPGQATSAESGVIAIFCSRLLNKQDVFINGDGTHTRDYVYVKDVAAANILATQSTETGIFNIGTGTETSTKQLFDQLSQLTAYNQSPQFRELTYQELDHSSLDASRAQDLLGWQPTVQLTTGLKETVAWYQKQS